MARREMREGDTRSFRHDPLIKVKWWPVRGYPFRWKPKHGDPECVGEKITQWTWSHRVLVYVACVTTLILVVQLFGVSFVAEVNRA